MNALSDLLIQETRVSDQGVGRRLARLALKNRVQLITALIVGIAGSYLLRTTFENIKDPLLSYSQTNIGLSLSILLGFACQKKMSRLPGNSALINIPAAILTAYITIAALFFMLRMDVSHRQFVISFFLVVLVFYAFAFIAARIRRPAYCLVPFGSAGKLKSIKHVDWIVVNSPDDASRFEQFPLVADLKSPELDRSWIEFISESSVSGRVIFNGKQLRESLEGKVEIEHISENNFGQLLTSTTYTSLKVILDKVAAFFALLLLSPLLIVIGVLIRLESKGPIIFKQNRIGQAGRRFTMYKFRSMTDKHPTPPSASTDMTRTDDDRITRIGRFIRKTRIDELPQLFNILKGDMSWIGPRPETENLSALYEQQIPFYRYRHIVKPGITGWAQIKQGHVTSVTDVNDKLRYDFYYIKNFSPWLDFFICLQTPRVMLTGLGAK